MSRLVVVLPLTPMHPGESFSLQDWPLHITVLAPFLTDAAPAEIAEAVGAAASTQPAPGVIVGRDEAFGRRGRVPVSLVRDSPDLTRLHDLLVEAVRPFASSPDELAFTGAEFRPHITIKPHGRAHEGDQLSLTQLALVDMAPRAAPGGRVVLATFPLRVG